MRAFAAVFAREIAERRIFFPVGLGSGVLFLLTSALIGWSRPGAADVRLLASMIGGALLTLVFGIGLGASVLAGETAEKRISFYLSRPIPAGSLWAGKLAAALVLSVGPAFLSVLPVLVAGGGFGRSSLAPPVEPAPVVAIFLAAAVFVVLGAHAAATVARLRSPWIALDAFLAGTCAVALLLLLRALVGAGVLPSVGVLSSTLFRALIAAVLAALLAASFVQVQAGRTDTRRAHGAFSATFWGIFLAALLALAAFAWVVTARSP